MILQKSSGPRCDFGLCCASRVGFPGVLCGYIDYLHSKKFRVRAKGAISRGKQLLAGMDVSETMRKPIEDVKTEQIFGPERGEYL